MTSNLNYKIEKKKGTAVGGSSLLLGVFALFFLLLMLKNATLSMEYIRKGLTICARTVVPSVFPFMVLSEILLSCPVGAADLSFLDAPCRKLLSLPKSGLLAVALGLLCGFPIGARCAADGYEKGQLTKEEAERTIALSSNPSPAFLLGAVGISMRGNRFFGWTLFGCLSAISLLFAFLFARHSKKEPVAILRSSLCTAQKNGWELLANAVNKAAQGMLTVCAYILFFAAITGCFELVALSLGLPKEFIAFAAAFLEISGGTVSALSLQSPLLSAAMTALAAGWSGCCVHCQILSVCEGSNLSLKPYLLVKVIQGLLCALIMVLLCVLFPSLLTVSP